MARAALASVASSELMMSVKTLFPQVPGDTDSEGTPRDQSANC